MISNKGDVIERIVRTKIGISELSRILHVSRTSIYNWFEHGHLNLETICKIGQAINHDFANEFPEEFANGSNQTLTNHTPSNMISGNGAKNENCESSVHYWMNKYISLLEKYNQVLTEITKSDLRNELVSKDATVITNNEHVHQEILIS